MVTIPKLRLENLEAKETHIETLKKLGLEKWSGYFSEEWVNNGETKKFLNKTLSELDLDKSL